MHHRVDFSNVKCAFVPIHLLTRANLLAIADNLVIFRAVAMHNAQLRRRARPPAVRCQNPLQFGQK